jgi:hypothetical protein
MEQAALARRAVVSLDTVADFEAGNLGVGQLTSAAALIASATDGAERMIRIAISAAAFNAVAEMHRPTNSAA